MRKAEKLFQLTNLIRSRQPITAEVLAEELEVSVRTIYRYIDDISANGIPIYGTAGVGYQMYENFELPPLTLTENELDALLLGAKMIKGWTGDKLSNSAKKLVSKIEAVLPKKLLEEYDDVVFAPDFMHSGELRKNWDAIHEAIKNSSVISIDYMSLVDVKSTREIYPLGLVYWGGKWTLGAWCVNKSDFRNFRIDRIESLLIHPRKFQKTNKISLKAFMRSNK